MVEELKPWVYVNGLLCRTKEAKDLIVNHYKRSGEDINITPVEMENGRYVLNLIDPMEQ